MQEVDTRESELVPRLVVRRQPTTGAELLRVAGDLDTATAQILRDALAAAIDEVGGVIVVEMTEVSFIDSMGLGTLVSGLKRAIEHGAQLRFVVNDPRIHKILDITGLVQVLDFHSTQEAAIAGTRDTNGP